MRKKVLRNTTNGRFQGVGKIIRECKNCNSQFEVYNSQRKFTCSPECSKKWRVTFQTGETNSHYDKNRGSKECPVCNKQFRLKRSAAVTCSFNCFRKLFIGRKPAHSKGGRRTDLGDHYFRSTWEANYARLLDYQKIKWVYEPKTFIFKEVFRGAKSYLPDFYLPDSDEYHEVKGWMKSTDRTKLKRMAKYFPDVKIVMIDRDVYLEYEKKYAFDIPTWEFSAATQSQANKKNAELMNRVRDLLREKGLI